MVIFTLVGIFFFVFCFSLVIKLFEISRGNETRTKFDILDVIFVSLMYFNILSKNLFEKYVGNILSETLNVNHHSTRHISCNKWRCCDVLVM